MLPSPWKIAPMRSSDVRLKLRLPTTDGQLTCLVEALMYDMRNASDAMIERTLADMMVGRHATDDCPEQLWETLFGAERIGFSFERGNHHVTITDDNGRARPALVGVLIQLIYPARLPLAFTYSSDTTDTEYRHSGGCVIVTDLGIVVNDATALAVKTAKAAGIHG